MKTYEVVFGPLVGTKRAISLIGDVDTLKIGDTLITESGEKIRIDAIGMKNRMARNSLSVLTNSTINTSIKNVMIP